MANAEGAVKAFLNEWCQKNSKQPEFDVRAAGIIYEIPIHPNYVNWYSTTLLTLPIEILDLRGNPPSYDKNR